MTGHEQVYLELSPVGTCNGQSHACQQQPAQLTSELRSFNRKKPVWFLSIVLM